MRMTNRIDARIFSLEHTFESGQPLTFYADFDKEHRMMSYPNGSHLITAIHKGAVDNGHIVLSSSHDVTKATADDLKKRMRLKDNMREIYKTISTDRFMRSAINQYKGMRLTLNDPWETTICFTISQFNNMKRIRLITKNLVSNYGKPIINQNGRMIAHSFPNAEQLSNVTKKDYLKHGTGFRAKYLESIADQCNNNIDLYKLQGKSYSYIKENLMQLDGIGDKVADCIALMGYGKLEAFPIDTWVKRTLEKTYFNGEKKSIEKLHNFANEKWGNYAGYAQQYIFWHGMHL
jgi:N-glycosylase/DNA lyase